MKFRGFEAFGVIERADGRAASETVDREWRQYAIDAVYRFLPREQLFAGIRYNDVSGQLAGMTTDVGAKRWQLAGGWFINSNLLMKGEYVNQTYDGFAPNDIRNGGKFHGAMLEGVVAF